MRLYDLQFHEGGTYEHEALETYKTVIAMAAEKRRAAQAAGQSTDENLSDSVWTVNEEVTLE